MHLFLGVLCRVPPNLVDATARMLKFFACLFISFWDLYSTARLFTLLISEGTDQRMDEYDKDIVGIRRKNICTLVFLSLLITAKF